MAASPNQIPLIRRRRSWLTCVLVLLILSAGGGIGALAWRLWPVNRAYYTDADRIREPEDQARIRDILWQPPANLSELINSPYDDYEPRVSADGLTLFFVRGKAGQNADIHVARRTPKGWTTPEPLTGVNSEHDDLGPQPTPDGTALYFYSDRPGGCGGYDIFMARLRPDGWSEAINLGPNVNSEFNDYGPALTPDGQTLYFASNRPQPEDRNQPTPDAWPATVREDLFRRDYDLYAAPISDRGAGPAMPLPELNSAYNDATPAVSPIGDFVYFSSDRPGGYGGFDLYRSRRLGTAHQPPTNLGPSINGLGNELDPGLDLGGFGLFFSSDRLAAADRADDAARTGFAAESSVPDREYDLYFTMSREVFRDVERLERPPIDWAAFWSRAGPNLLWALLALLLVLLLLALLGNLRSRRMSLLTKCLLGSLLAHLLLMLLFNAWEIGAALVGEYRRGGPIRVALASPMLGDEIASQIRGGTVEISAPAPKTIETMRVPPTPPTTKPLMLVAIPEQKQREYALDDSSSVPFSRRDAIVSAQPNAPEVNAKALPDPRSIQMDVAAPRDASRIDQPETQVDVSQNAGVVREPRQASASVIESIAARRELAEMQPEAVSHSPAAFETRALPTPVFHDLRDAPLPTPDGSAQPVPTPPADSPMVNASITKVALPQSPSAQQMEEMASQPSPAMLNPARPVPVGDLDSPRRALQRQVEVPPDRTLIVTAFERERTISLPGLHDTTRAPDAPTPTTTPSVTPLHMLPHDLNLPSDATGQDHPPAGETAVSIKAELTADAVRSSPLDRSALVPAKPVNLSPVAPVPQWAVDLVAAPIPSSASDADSPSTAPQSPLFLPRVAGSTRHPLPLPDLETAQARLSEESASPAQTKEAAGNSVPRAALPDVQPADSPARRDLNSHFAPLERTIDLAADMQPRNDFALPHDALSPHVDANRPAETRSRIAKPGASILPVWQPELKLPSEVQPRENPYAHREPHQRQKALERMGGSPQTEDAVAQALRWLARHQSDDGRWDGNEFDASCGQCGGETDHQVDVALTGLALLCFLGNDHTHFGDGPYRHTVRRAVEWLVDRQSGDGDLRDGETLYSQGIAAIALSEAYGMTGDPSLKQPVQHAIRFIHQALNHDVGGWRYEPGQAGDTSVSGWQVMAMKSAAIGGVEVSEIALEAARSWLELVSRPPRSGRYAYQPARQPNAAMTAEGLFMQLLLGVHPSDPRNRASAEFILNHPPQWGEQANTYFWYYATLALFQMQGDAWQRWNESLKPVLLQSQIKQGPRTGSWDPVGEWAHVGGRVYQTAVCTLMLEVYYRYLPLFSHEADFVPIGTIRGKVTDAASGHPIPGAAIRIDRPGAMPVEISSDAQGLFELPVPDVPDHFALSVSARGYVPHSADVAAQDVRSRVAEVNFLLDPTRPDVIAVEEPPEVHHLGDNRFEGRINSQFQKESEGAVYIAPFELRSKQLPPGLMRAQVHVMVKGVQRAHKVVINDVVLDQRLDDAPSDGSFGLFVIDFDIKLLKPGRNTLEIRAKPSDVDIDDFEFVNPQIHLLP